MCSNTPPYQDLRATATSAEEQQRLDQALAQCFPLSRRRIRRAIDEGGVYLNKKRCRTAGRKVRSGDQLRMVLLEGEKLRPLETEQLIWQQPPLYMLHKRSKQYAQEALHRSKGTLPSELAALLKLPPKEAALLRPVHRLDRDTSGLMLFSSDPKALQQLQKFWQQCAMKSYLAVVEPAPTWHTKTIELAIGKVRDARGCYHISEHGRHCKTDVELLEQRNNRALLKLTPHTGRTHQLRVHLSALGCPILGDRRYGGKPHHRLMLHAEQLRITTPALKETITWNAPPEEDWQW